MNEKVISQVFAVLDKYDKSYEKGGVLANLNAWEWNKGPLVNLLRKHPNWNEDALAVTFEVTQSREIDRYLVNEYNSSVFLLSSNLGLSDEDSFNLRRALDTAVGSYAKLLPDEQVVSSIQQYSGVSVAVGQKSSRAINKICQRYGLDKHPEYNARFAQLADSLNPLQVKRKALLSVHPCDFLEMSNEDNSWSSCHCIREGEYHAGTLSYLNDAVSMVFYTVDDDITEDFFKAPKRTRQVFCYGDGILLQSRLYPHTDDEEARDIYRDIVQRTISHCLDIPNLWTLKRHNHVDGYCSTHQDALHYTDYSYGSYKPTVSLLHDIHIDYGKTILIGNTAYCLDCSCAIGSNDSLYCDSCGDDVDYISCECCGEQIERDSDEDYYVANGHYCRDCVSFCEHCHEYTRDEMTSVISRLGCYLSVCEYCFDQHYFCCEDCGDYFHSERGEVLEGEFHCSACLENHYHLCDRCGEYVHHQDAVEMEGNGYCADCAEEIQAEQEEETVCLVTA